MKNDKKIKNYIITSVLVIVFVLSAYKIVTKVSGDLKSEAVYSELRSNNKEEDGKCIKEDLSNINKDFVGWVTIDNTDLEYPFVQGEDNDHYLHRDINHNDSTAGTIFMDYRDNLDSSQNIILYGHHMKNGTMFTPVVKYKEEDFWKKNNKIRVYIGSHEYIYEVYAVCVVDPATYDYLKMDFDTEKDFLDYVDGVRERSMYKSDLKVSGKDKIITLSTCSYEFDNARTFVQGKLIEEK